MKLKKGTGLVTYSPTKKLLNERFIADAVWECLKNNDPEGENGVMKMGSGLKMGSGRKWGQA